MGACVGEKSRPLNGGTRRVPARQPRCASRAIAWSASHSPLGRAARSTIGRSDSMV